MQETLEHKLFKFWDSNFEYYHIAENIEYEPYFANARNRLIEEISDNSKVLDMACGSAELLRDISRKATYFGVDVSSAALHLANKRKNANSHLIRANVSKLPIRKEALDCIICINSVEHFVKPWAVIDEIWRICKKGGKIIILSPNWGDFIFRMPPPLAKSQNLIFKIRYCLSQFIYQSIRIFGKRAYFFPVIDCSSALEKSFIPDNDTVYITSIREVGNYFRNLCAQKIHIEFRKDQALIKPFLRNLFKNLFRLFKKLNPYYKYHGANLIIITK